jgi:hypothetical protein
MQTDNERQAWPFEKLETGFPKRGIGLAYTTARL